MSNVDEILFRGYIHKFGGLARYSFYLWNPYPFSNGDATENPREGVSLKDKAIIQETNQALESWLTSEVKSCLPGMSKAWIYQHGILPCIIWTLKSHYLQWRALREVFGVTFTDDWAYPRVSEKSPSTVTRLSSGFPSAA